MNFLMFSNISPTYRIHNNFMIFPKSLGPIGGPFQCMSIKYLICFEDFPRKNWVILNIQNSKIIYLFPRLKDSVFSIIEF
jgi:hypothetical protein